MDTRGFPTTLPEFQKCFPDDGACRVYLERMRWPDGFICLYCGHKGEPYRFPTRPTVVLRCRVCKKNTSLTAGTVMHKAHMPLSTWFWGAYLVTTQTPGQSAIQFQRQLGLARYETAYMLLHKLRSGMVRPERDTIGGEHAVEVDEVLIGGKARGAGRGKHHKVYVLGAVEQHVRRLGEDRSARAHDGYQGGKPLKRPVYAGRLRLQVVPDRKAATCEAFMTANVTPGTMVKTDGWQGYDDLAEKLGYSHDGLAMNADPALTDAHLPLIHLVFSNLKAWILGTHHGVSQQHLQAYCNEYVFRFNRRFYPMTAFNSVLGIAARTMPPTYAELYSGEWTHPIGAKVA